MMRGTLYTIGAALLGCVVLWQVTDGFRAITAEGKRRVTVADSPRPVPNLELEMMDGSLQNLVQPTPTLIEFIYTTCPDFCQASGGDFAELRDHFKSRNLHPRMISISFDPEADDPEAMRTYAALHGATGDPWTVARPRASDISALLKTFDVTVIPDIWGGFEHNIAVLLIDSGGAFSGVFDTRAFDEIITATKAAF